MTDNQKAFLISKGIDLDNAINYTGDLETYHEILLDFYDNIDNQFNDIKNSINDLPNYAILVHALKSNARTLGIKFLADEAYNHEMASKANDANYCISNLSKLEQAVNDTKVLIENYKNN